MRIILIRHGDAYSSNENPQRPLTEQGIAKAKKIGTFLRNTDLNPSLVYCSPKLRAKQTAEIIVEAMNLDKNVLEENDKILPNGNVEEFFDDVKDFDFDIIVVSHLPFVSFFASFVLSGALMWLLVLILVLLCA